jgi:hypothetical protein
MGAQIFDVDEGFGTAADLSAVPAPADGRTEEG